MFHMKTISNKNKCCILKWHILKMQSAMHLQNSTFSKIMETNAMCVGRIHINKG